MLAAQWHIDTMVLPTSAYQWSALTGLSLEDAAGQSTSHPPLGVDELLKRADLATYQAKTAGRNTLRFFDPSMQEVVATRAAMEADLRRGLQRN